MGKSQQIAAQFEKIDTIARRTFGLNEAARIQGSLSLRVLTDHAIIQVKAQGAPRGNYPGAVVRKHLRLQALNLLQSGAQQDAVSTYLQYTIYGSWRDQQAMTDRTLHERRNQYINSSKRNKIKTLDRQNGQEEGKH